MHNIVVVFEKVYNVVEPKAIGWEGYREGYKRVFNEWIMICLWKTVRRCRIEGIGWKAMG